jgi:2-polyprenyl-3-methyl-5-hydroxy-6-metoxy-1,4-benzoquinol methylase
MDQYLDRIYATYSSLRPYRPTLNSPADLLAGREPVFRNLFLPWVPARKNARILDVGCGFGEFLYFLQREGYRSAEGIDLNRQQLEIGASLGVRNQHCGDARAFLARLNEQFDFISALDVLEHVRKCEVLDFLDAVQSALRPGGRFLCQVPNMAAFHTPLFHMDFSHETPFTAPTLRQVLELTNFINVRVSPVSPVPHGAKSALRSILWKAVTAGLRLIQTVEGGPRPSSLSIFTASIFAVAEKLR